MLILYGLPVSTYTTKVRIALHAKGIAFDERLPPGGYGSYQWRAIAPTGTIPAIDHDGFLLAESEAIIEYLDEAFEGPSLLPGDRQARARVRLLARVHDFSVEPAVRALFPLIRDPAQRDALPARVTALEKRLVQLERLRESAAGPVSTPAVATGADWMAGHEFSSADCGFAVSLPLARRLLDALEQPLAMPASLESWIERSVAHPGVAAGLAPWWPAAGAWLDQAMGARR